MPPKIPTATLWCLFLLSPSPLRSLCFSCPFVWTPCVKNNCPFSSYLINISPNLLLIFLFWLLAWRSHDSLINIISYPVETRFLPNLSPLPFFLRKFREVWIVSRLRGQGLGFGAQCLRPLRCTFQDALSFPSGHQSWVHGSANLRPLQVLCLPVPRVGPSWPHRWYCTMLAEAQAYGKCWSQLWPSHPT